MVKIMNELVIASHNKGKVAEIQNLLQAYGYVIHTATDFNITEPEETGDSFEANAALKAEHTCQATNKPSLADDSGLEVLALNNAPGIYSARWAGPNKDFGFAIKTIQEELIRRQQPTNTPAQFVCVLAFAAPHQPTKCFRGTVTGRLTFPPRGVYGFGYDPIFIPDGHHKTFAEMLPEEKHKISHRAKAFQQLQQFLCQN